MYSDLKPKIDLVNLDRRLENPCQGEQCARVEGQDGAAPEPRDAHGPEDNQALTLSTRCKGPRGRGTQAGLLSQSLKVSCNQAIRMAVPANTR